MTARVSLAPSGLAEPPRRTLATRILLSFAVTLLAFAVTVGFTVLAQKRAAEDSDELAKGYVPVALKLGRLRAVQSTLASIVDGIPDEKNPLSTRILLETLTSERRAMFDETRAAIQNDLRELGSEETRQLALVLTGELDATQAAFAGDRASLERLFAAFDAGDRDGINKELIALGTMEHDAEKRLRALAEKVERQMNELSAAARAREQRALLELALLTALTLAVGIGVSIHTRRLLGPLERVTQRAQAVARGDLTPQPIPESEDEIGQLAGAFERMVGAVAKAQSRAVANERLAAIGKMAAHVTHEIRNPLSSIALNLELLEEELPQSAEEANNLLRAIKAEVERLSGLSEQYLSVARQRPQELRPEKLSEIVEEACEFVRRELQQAGATLKLENEAGDRVLRVDEAQIRQALLNLLRNAREAMPQGGQVVVGLRGSDDGGIDLTVDDEGVGMPAATRARLFEPFFTTKQHGTGLGLAITRQIAEAHGGHIRVEAREPKGTRIVLHLGATAAE
jgi:signal transduction histidine kinase